MRNFNHNTTMADGSEAIRLSAFLTFLDRDIDTHPGRLEPMLEDDLVRLRQLAEGVSASDADTIPDDVTF